MPAFLDIKVQMPVLYNSYYIYVGGEEFMVYVTGDCHGDFRRFSKKGQKNSGIKIADDDYIIVCGDFALLWAKNRELEYNLGWFSQLPYTVLWVQGNHENYNMIEGYPLEEWHGGKVRHIVRDKVILLERGQVFTIEDKTFFTFGGASSHDISGGILDRGSPAYKADYRRAKRSGKPFRILNESWWEHELPDEADLEEGSRNLARAGYKVDYVISHCGSNRLQEALECYYMSPGWFGQDILTNYFEELEDKLQYKHWFCGHYHEDLRMDSRHTILYHSVVPVESGGVYIRVNKAGFPNQG